MGRMKDILIADEELVHMDKVRAKAEDLDRLVPALRRFPRLYGGPVEVGR